MAYTTHSGALLIQPLAQTNTPLRIVVELNGLTAEQLEREIVSRYISGTDEIVITGTPIPPTIRKHVRMVSQALLGLELIDESAQEILIKNIFDIKTLSPAQTLAKLFSMTVSMFQDAFQALRKDDKKLAQDVIQRDSEVDKLQLVVTRQFHSLLSGRVAEETLGISIHQLHYFEKIAVQLERVADHSSKIAEAVWQAKRPLKKALQTPETARTANKLLALLSETSAMVASKNRRHAHAILDSNATLEKQIDRIGAATQHETHRGMVLEIALDRLRGYIMNIAEMTIDYANQEL